MRKDWLEKLGIKQQPKTLDEYLNVMEAITQKDPNGNGSADTWGWTGSVGSDGAIQGFNPILGAFEALGDWRIEDGKLVPMATTDNRKKALQFINRMSNAKVLDPDWKAQQSQDSDLKWKSGRIGVITGDWCSVLCPANYKTQFAKANPKGVLEIVQPPVGPNAHSSTGLYSNVGDMYGLSKKTAGEKGEAIARLMEWINGPGYMLTTFGEEGKGYTRDSSGHVVVTEGEKYESYRDSGALQLTRWGIKGGETEWALRYGGTTVQGDGSKLDIVKDVLDRAVNKAPKTDVTKFAPLPPAPPSVSADLTRTISQGEFGFATGSKSFSEWDSYVESVKSAGLDEWLKQATKRAKETGLLE